MDQLESPRPEQRIKWDFKDEKLLNYTDGMEAINNLFLAMQQAGYEQPVLDMFDNYTDGMRGYANCCKFWPVVLETFIHDRGQLWNYAYNME